jgi:hypothetical protein
MIDGSGVSVAYRDKLRQAGSLMRAWGRKKLIVAPLPPSVSMVT